MTVGGDIKGLPHTVGGYSSESGFWEVADTRV